jgi:hypothetical protein
MASRSVARDTPSWRASSGSAGMRSPGGVAAIKSASSLQALVRVPGAFLFRRVVRIHGCFLAPG